jgi:diacylglycerol kinase family enzyme
MSRRLLALASLLFVGVTAAFAVTGVVQHPLAILVVLLSVAGVLEGVVMVVTNRGTRRAFGAVIAGAGLIACIGVLVAQDALGSIAGVFAAGVVTTILAVLALRPRAYRPPAQPAKPPEKPFILMNLRSGGGKVKRFDLDGKARRLGAEVAYLEDGVDVGRVLRQAVRNGADLLGAAGGDGTQALVAQIAADEGLPILCIPAGTRNHFALDLGLDRDDPGLALDALGDAGEEIRIDLGDVGGRPFVNNVSLGVYAEIVARPEYRGAKLTTVMAVLPEVTRPGVRSNLTIEADGLEPIEDPQVVQVANNPYAKDDEPAPAGTRPRLDTGVLGVDVVAYRTPAELRRLVVAAGEGKLDRTTTYRSWTGRRLRVRSRDGTVRAGVDGESIEFPSPLEITIRPRALRLRVPKDRPGPKVGWPRVDPTVVRELWSIAFP